MKDDGRVPLTPRILDLLITLVERRGELVSKETLLKEVWPDSFVEEGNINRTVSTLRKNLGSQANGSGFIETVPKLGYRFIASVNEISEYPAGNSISEDARPEYFRIWVGAVGVLILIGFFFYYYLSRPANPVDKDGLVNITNTLAEDDYPGWSPDGRKITFVSNRDGANDIYSMNADGSGIERLTNTLAAEHSMTWSPDGTKILFESDRDGNSEIYVMNADGSNQTRLTFNPTSDGGPSRFSPDGKKIVFARSAANAGEAFYNFDIYVMDADGSNLRQLTTDAEYDAGPSWSPDGTRIAFVSGREKNFDVFVMDPDGSGQTNLTKSSENEVPIGWTPDGGQLIYVGDTDVKRELYQIWLVNSDGSDKRQLTSFTDKFYRVAFSPAGKKFALSSKKDGNFEIYLMDAANLLTYDQ